MLQIYNASHTNLNVSGTISFHLPLGESRTGVTFGVLHELFVQILLTTTLIDIYMKLVRPVERKIGPHHSGRYQY